MMPRLIIAFLVLITAACLWFVTMGAQSLAQKALVKQLQGAGFPQASITDLSAGPSNTAATDIKLDAEGLDTVKSITTSSGWLSLLTGNDNIDITIDKPDIVRKVDNVSALLPGLMSLQRESVLKLPKGNIILRDGRISLNTPLGDFQYLFDIVIEPAKDDGRRLVTATLKSFQPNLDFISDWRGWIEPDGTLLVDASVPEVKTNIGPVRLTRGNGWLSLSNAGTYPSLSGQIESGGASFGTLPLQNFSLTLDVARNAVTILSRSYASGAEQSVLAADVVLEQNNRQISLTLTSENIDSFFTYLDSAVARDTASLRETFKDKNRLQLSVDYQLTKRFPGGPYPFDMSGELDGEEFLSGTFLVYPGTFDMRGSAKVDSPYLSGIREYFKLPDASVSGDYIRLDASLAPFVSGVSAGVENNLGKGP